ncbi:MAG: hypothetical protein LBS35_14305 [Synergistaceae bacterium]|nr:hypothetical protein [Synergistaceae bacterium]
MKLLHKNIPIRAEFHPVPLVIQRLFFDRLIFQFTPAPDMQQEEFTPIILPRSLAIAATMQIMDDGFIQIRVNVTTNVDINEDILTHFDISCVGLYTWNSDSKTIEESQKDILAWTSAIQLGAVRDRVASETANGPFFTPYYIPVCLVGIKPIGETTETH